MNETRARRALARALSLASMLGGCGGPACATSPASPECHTFSSPPPFGKTLIAAAGFSGLAPHMLASVPFRIPTPGVLDATVDWTFTTDNVDVYIGYGSCTVDQFNNGTCHVVAFSESASAKPERVGVSELGPGYYSLFIGNRGPDEESVSYQIFLTTFDEGPIEPPPDVGRMGRTEDFVGMLPRP
jgi:hypothetical protein